MIHPLLTLCKMQFATSFGALSTPEVLCDCPWYLGDSPRTVDSQYDELQYTV